MSLFNFYRNHHQSGYADEGRDHQTGHDRFCRTSARAADGPAHFPGASFSRPRKKRQAVFLSLEEVFSPPSPARRKDPGSLSRWLSRISVFGGGGRRSSTSMGRSRSCDPSPSYGQRGQVPRHRMRHEYTSLENEAPVAESLEMKEKRSQRAEDAGSALVTCQGFVRASGRYTLVERLPDMGSRIHKHWFVVRDASLKTERLLTMVPQTDTCPMAFTTHTRKTLVELFLALQHPYIYPILDVDFKDCYVLTVLPLSAQGSLKDVIHRSICRDEWRDKYRVRCSGLPLAQIQRIGRQILEALLFLRDRGFPSFGHLHSGNIIIQNGVARLTGFENTLLGYTSRIFPTLRHRVHGESIDSLCFGHVIFEMAAGYELNVAHPTVKNMQDIKCQQTITQLLSFIFDREDGRYPTLEEIAAVDFFRNLDLREMRCSMPPPPFFQTKLSSSVKNLLKEVRRHQRDFWQRKRRSTSVDTTLVVLETTPYCSVADLASPSTSTSNNDRSEEYHTPPDTPTSFPEGSSINNNNGEDEDDDNFGNNNYAGNDNDSLV